MRHRVGVLSLAGRGYLDVWASQRAYFFCRVKKSCTRHTTPYVASTRGTTTAYQVSSIGIHKGRQNWCAYDFEVPDVMAPPAGNVSSDSVDIGAMVTFGRR